MQHRKFRSFQAYQCSHVAHPGAQGYHRPSAVLLSLTLRRSKTERRLSECAAPSAHR